MLAIIISFITLVSLLIVFFAVLFTADFDLSEWEDMDPIKIEPWLFDKYNRTDYYE